MVTHLKHSRMVGIVALCREEEQYTKWLSESQLAYTIVHDEAEAAGVTVMIFCGGPDWGKRPERPPDLDRRVDSPALSGRGSRPSGRTSG